MQNSILIKVLISLILGAFLVHCEKPPKTGTDVGSEAKIGTIVNYLTSAQNGIDRLDIKKGEKALFHRALYVATAPRAVQATLEKTGFERLEDEQYLRIEMTQDTHVYKGEQPIDDFFQHYIWFFPKNPQPNNEELVSPAGITFHNLDVTSNNEAEPPAAVKATPDCRKTPNCKMQTQTIAFDQLAWSGDKFRKMRYQISFSPTVPAIANPIRSCQSLTLMLPREEGSSVKTPVFIHYCSELMDYIYAPPTGSSPTQLTKSQSSPASADEFLARAALAALQAQAAEEKNKTPSLFQKLSFDQLYTTERSSGIIKASRSKHE